MRQLAIIFFLNWLLSDVVVAQSKSDCFEIKYLDFFGIDEFETIKWPEAELDQLLLKDFRTHQKGRDRKTNFLVPIIIWQLKDYHPSCLKAKDTSVFRKLTQLYYNIRQQDITSLTGESLSTQLEIIRQDFYEQVQNDSLLPYMTFTFDDGPFFGQVSKFEPNANKQKRYDTEFGSIIITNNSGEVSLTVINRHGRHLWTRVMTVDSNRVLSDINFNEKNIIKSSLGYMLKMSSEGEALTLYLRNNGDIRYYFHSW